MRYVRSDIDDEYLTIIKAEIRDYFYDRLEDGKYDDGFKERQVKEENQNYG